MKVGSVVPKGYSICELGLTRNWPTLFFDLQILPTKQIAISGLA